MDDIAYHKELLNAGVIHKTKENLVVAVSEGRGWWKCDTNFIITIVL